MENLLYDYHIAKAMGDNLPNSENYKKALYVESVYKKYGTTEAVFDSSMVWYTRNTEILTKVYEKVTKRLKAQQDAINHLVAIREKKATTSTPGDSVDVWAWQRMIRLSGMPMNNKLTFIIPSDSNFKNRDTLVWQVRYHFLDKEPKKISAALMAIQIRYENDSTVSEIKKVNQSGMQTIRIQADTLGAIKEIKGFIYYPGKESSRALLADQISLTRYHSNDSLRALKDSLQADSVKVDSTTQLRTGDR